MPVFRHKSTPARGDIPFREHGHVAVDVARGGRSQLLGHLEAECFNGSGDGLERGKQRLFLRRDSAVFGARLAESEVE